VADADARGLHVVGIQGNDGYILHCAIGVVVPIDNASAGLDSGLNVALNVTRALDLPVWVVGAYLGIVVAVAVEQETDELPFGKVSREIISDRRNDLRLRG